MASAKVIHLIKRVEQIEKEIQELHQIASSVAQDRSYRNALKIAAEQQINNLIGEKVKLMELKIENPPEFLTKHVEWQEEKHSTQPRISLESLQHTTTTALSSSELQHTPQRDALNRYAQQMSISKILPPLEPAKSKVAKASPVKSRAELLKELPPLQY